MNRHEGRGRVVHLCLACVYCDGYAYQENLLPRAHKRRGWDVEIIASRLQFGENGRLVEVSGAKEYLNEDGIRVHRVDYSRVPLARRLRLYRGVAELLERTEPDIIFVHGTQFLEALGVRRYVLRNPQVRLFMDNHADFNNSAGGWLSRNLLHKILWRFVTRRMDSVTTRFYGVLPARVDFLHDVYGIAKERIELLPMGADDVTVARMQTVSMAQLRSRFGLPCDKTLIVTGGKIDHNKPEILDLLRAFQDGPNGFELVAFGNVVQEYEQKFNELIKSPRVHYLGWLSAEDSMAAMAASDLVVFPGLHSVMWEQAVALGKPLMLRRIHGTQHLDLGGNIMFLNSGTQEAIADALNALATDQTLLPSLTRNAFKREREDFLYDRIAEASLS